MILRLAALGGRSVWFCRKRVQKNKETDRRVSVIWPDSREKRRKRWWKGLFIIACVLVALSVFRYVAVDWAYVPTSSMEPTICAGSWVWYEKRTYGALYPRRFAEVPLLNWLCLNRSFAKSDRQRDWGYRRMPGKRLPARADVIVFAFSSGSGPSVMKRIVGMPGDTLEIRKDTIFIDKKPWMESGSRNPAGPAVPAGYPALKKTSWSTRNYGPLVIPARGSRWVIDSAFVALYADVLEREGRTISRIRNKWLVDGRVSDRYVFRYHYYFVLGDNRSNSLDSRFCGLVSETSIRGKVILSEETVPDGKTADNLAGLIVRPD